MNLFSIPPEFLLMYSVYLIGTASPGPSNMSIMAVAIHKGRGEALTLAAGVITGSITWGLLAGFGLATVLGAWGHFLIALKVFGGLYLLWLAYRSGRSALRNGETSHLMKGSFHSSRYRLYLQGVAMHLTNPKAVFSWVATISVGLSSNPTQGDVLLALLGCFGLGFLIFFSYALVFSTPAVQNIFNAWRRWVDGALTVVYGYAGIRLLLSK